MTVDPPPKPHLRWGTGYTVNEGDTVMLTATITSALPNDIVIEPLLVPVNFSGYANLADFDFCASFLLRAGQTTSEPCELTALLNDDDGDGDTYDPGNTEIVIVGFESITGVTTHYCYNCIDIVDVPPLEVSFGSATYSVDEGSSRTVTVSLSSAPGRNVVVPLVFAGTATSTTDYTAPASVTFGPTDTQASFAVSASTDTVDDDNETVVVSFGALPTGIIEGTPTQTTVTINDVPPPPVVSLSDTALSVAETNTTGVSITAVLDKPAPTAASVTVTATGAARGAGSCYPGVEFYLSSSSFSFGVGASSASITLYPCGDADYNNETVTVSLTTVGIAGLTLGSPTTVVVTIVDPAPPVVSVAGPGTVDESAGTATFTITLSKTWTSAVLVDVDTVNGTATAPSDYSSVNRTVTINAGSTSVTVPVTVIDDTIVETDETFTVTLSNPTNATLGTVTATGTIRNDDVPPPVVSVTGPGTVDESAGTATFTINLSKTWTAAVLVDVDTVNGTATAGSDYSSVNRTVTINAGSTSVSVPVTVIDDTVVETDETFTVTLTNATNATLGTVTATGTIRDDDVPPPTTVPGPGF